MEHHKKLDTLIESEGLTWKEILYEVIKGMNPWNIDIIELATRYSQKVQQMTEMNFRIPANVVLVSSVLLRMKSDVLEFGRGEDNGDYSYLLASLFDSRNVEEMFAISELEREVPIELEPARVLRRRISAVELIAAIQAVLEEKRPEKKKKDNGEQLLIVAPEIEIGKLIDEVYSRIMAVLANKSVAMFSEIASSREQKLMFFVPLLHLTKNQRIMLKQEHIFEEIFIYPPGV